MGKQVTAKDVARGKATESLADSEPRIPGTSFPESAGMGDASVAHNGIKAIVSNDGTLHLLKDGQVQVVKAPKVAQLMDQAADYLTAKGAAVKKTLAKGAQAVEGMASKAAPSLLDDLFAGARVLSGPVGLGLATALTPTEANAGEDERIHATNTAFDQGQAQPAGVGLDAQTENAMGDPGINPQAPPTKNLSAMPSNRPATPAGQDLPQAATMSDTSNAGSSKTTFDRDGNPVSTVQTGGGDYPVYNKSSGEAADFRGAFADAMASKQNTFMWQGREYNTKVAGQ